ncbi:MAG: M48 family metallopeptidase [Alphaproteobacteria bacterium]|uniref:M48 family metallopeptidase n=1 Tax=Candidatus Nitrobium versatile TaxID=2884831 RepID=A0A953J4Q6_9BACT|nr:M48 family metallopeptidase [Candidatus Nitrobium versatile]
MQRAGASVPPEFSGHIDGALMKKAQEYGAEKTRFGLFSSLFSTIATLVFLFGGVLNLYNSWIVSLNLSFIVSGWLFFLLLSYAGELLSLPFSLYNTFRIENKYGFNTMTPGIWVSDFIKSFLLSTILLSLLLFAGLWLVQWSPRFWWFWVWGFLFFFSVFLLYLSPYVIEPLFNTFTPVEDALLRKGIGELTERAGIHAGRILKIDASRRSRHTNAYFTGIGRTKRIVLYDTLLESMSHPEILAVLAHEIGHWKKRHLLKALAAFEVFSFLSLYAAYRLTQGDFLIRLFALGADTLFAKLVLLGFLAGIISLPLKPVVTFFSRWHERQADRASFELTKDTEAMVSALVKLSKENLSNLYPHPLYVALYYSHPPVVQRIRHLRTLS